MDNNVISKMDLDHLDLIRQNVSNFLSKCAKKYDKTGILLDIAPQIYEGAGACFKSAKVETLDIDSSSNATYIADICNSNNEIIPDNYADFVVCTEVLEHVIDPFAAVAEIYRIVKPNGFVFLSVPFNFRIHGPLPDCWRFTKHGLEVLLKKFTVIDLEELETEGRWLMPLQYTVIAQKLKK